MHETLLERESRTRKGARIGFWCALLLLSLTLLRHFVVSVETYRPIIRSLDGKRETVFGLITASTAISAAITLIPGDVGTPIAQQITQLSEYFLMVLGALYLEKYLLTILGFVSSVILVPGSCLLSVAHELKPGSGWKKRLAIMLLIVGIAGVLVIPASVLVSNTIDKTFHESIQTTVDSVLELSGELEETGEETDTSLWESITNAAQSVTSGVSGALDEAKTAVNRIIESVVIMLVTDCVIPIAVVLFFIWLVKTVVKALYAPSRPSLPPPEDDERR